MNWLLFGIIILVPNGILSKHFYGGTIRWIPLTNNASTVPIQILITQIYMYNIEELSTDGTTRTCTIGSLLPYPIFQLKCTANCGSSGGYQSLPISTYVTGSSSALRICYSQRTDLVNLTNINAYFTVTYGTDPGSFYTYRSLSTGLTTTTSSANWNLSTIIDIRRRSNGLINTPPVANLMSPYGIPYNIRTSIQIPTSDIDGDDVRCRWSSGAIECGEVCFPRTIPSTTTLSSNCVLNITGLAHSVWYCAAIQVEDFSNKTATTPFSSVPLQILFYVYNTTNCSAPELSSPYSCLSVLINTAYTTTIYAHNYCGSSVSITDINIQTLPGITTSSLTLLEATNKSLYSKTITYTPNSNQIGVQMLCSTAINSKNIPSAQYCIKFIVRSSGSSTGLPCMETTTKQTTFVTSEIITSKSIDITMENIPITTASFFTSQNTPIINSVADSSAIPTSDEVMTSIVLTSTEELTSMEISSRSSTNSILISTTPVESKSKINWLLIVGISLAFIALLGLLACCCCYWFLILGGHRRRRKRNKSHEKLPSQSEKLIPKKRSWKSRINCTEIQEMFNKIIKKRSLAEIEKSVSKTETDKSSETNNNIYIIPSRISATSPLFTSTRTSYVTVDSRYDDNSQISSMPHVSIVRVSRESNTINTFQAIDKPKTNKYLVK